MGRRDALDFLHREFQANSKHIRVHLTNHHDMDLIRNHVVSLIHCLSEAARKYLALVDFL